MCGGPKPCGEESMREIVVLMAIHAPQTLACSLHMSSQAMSGNYFLWIVVVVSALAVASKLSGAI